MAKLEEYQEARRTELVEKVQDRTELNKVQEWLDKCIEAPLEETGLPKKLDNISGTRKKTEPSKHDDAD